MNGREVWGRQRIIFNWMLRLKHSSSRRSEEHLGPVLLLRGCSVLLHPSRYRKEGLRSSGLVFCNVVRMSRGGGRHLLRKLRCLSISGGSLKKKVELRAPALPGMVWRR